MPYIVERNSVVNADAIYVKRDKPRYKMDDLDSIYTHYNPLTGRNEPTPNRILSNDTNKGGKR